MGKTRRQIPLAEAVEAKRRKRITGQSVASTSGSTRGSKSTVDASRSTQARRKKVTEDARSTRATSETAAVEPEARSCAQTGEPGSGVDGNEVGDNLLHGGSDGNDFLPVDYQFDLSGASPRGIASIHSGVGVHVSSALKNKIVSGRYVDLALLLDMSPASEDTKNLEVSQSGHLVLKSTQPSKAIQTIEAWSDAFLIYASIFLAAHPHRLQEIIKYMTVIRLAAKRHSGLGWKHYDQQFRLRLEADPTGISFSYIDYELWLIYVGAPTAPVDSTSRTNKKCFDYNYRQCFRPQCSYKHSCLICNNVHQSRLRLCSLNRGQGQSFRTPRPARASVSQGQRRFVPQSGFGARPRFPFPTTSKP